MSDHRALQRALFRMQMDAGFARRVFDRDPGALGSAPLAPDDWEMLWELDPRAVAADAGDARKKQLLGNLASEYALSCGIAPAGLLEQFLVCEELHEAIQADRPLPVAFGRYVLRRAEGDGAARRAALAQLELAMVELRRRRASPPQGPPGTLFLSPQAGLVRLMDGTLEWASRIQTALESADSVPDMVLSSDFEDLLLLAGTANPHALPNVVPERLEPSVAKLLRRAEMGLDSEGKRSLAQELGANSEDIDRFASSLVEEGILIRVKD